MHVVQASDGLFAGSLAGNPTRLTVRRAYTAIGGVMASPHIRHLPLAIRVSIPLACGATGAPGARSDPAYHVRSDRPHATCAHPERAPARCSAQPRHTGRAESPQGVHTARSGGSRVLAHGLRQHARGTPVGRAQEELQKQALDQRTINRWLTHTPSAAGEAHRAGGHKRNCQRRHLSRGPLINRWRTPTPHTASEAHRSDGPKRNCKRRHLSRVPLTGGARPPTAQQARHTVRPPKRNCKSRHLLCGPHLGGTHRWFPRRTRRAHAHRHHAARARSRAPQHTPAPPPTARRAPHPSPTVTCTGTGAPPVRGRARVRGVARDTAHVQLSRHATHACYGVPR